MRNAINTHQSTLKNNVHIDFQNSVLFHVAVANHTAWIGLKIGAIIIAPITTGVALINNHKVATTIERNI